MPDKCPGGGGGGGGVDYRPWNWQIDRPNNPATIGRVKWKNSGHFNIVVSFCFSLIVIHYHIQKQMNIKFKTKDKTQWGEGTSL